MWNTDVPVFESIINFKYQNPHIMNSKGTKILLGLLALAFGLLALFFGVKYKQALSENVVHIEEKQEISTEYDELNAEFDELNIEFEALKAKNEELDGALSAKIQEAQDVRDEVSRLLKDKNATQAELNRARKLIASLRQENSNLMASVKSLTEENTGLKTENRSLTTTINVVSREKTELEEEKTQLVEQTETLTQEKEELQAANEELTPKAEYGSVINIGNLFAEGVKYKNSGKERTTRSSKRVEKIKVCFNVNKNPVVKPGQQEYLVRIISPEGVALHEEDRGSGIFTNAEGGEQMKYTTRTYVNYENEPKNVCLYWTQNLPFEEGIYTAEIYHHGFNVGTQQFELR